MAVPADESLRQAAADWFARMRGPDSDRDRPAFEAWRAADSANGAAYDRLVARWDAAALLGQTATGRARQLTKPVSPLQRRGVQFAMAAAVIAAVGTTALLLSPDTFGVGAAATSVSQTGAGQIRVLALADGSRLTLDTDSAVRVALSQTERRVDLLRGRARFQVAHDPKRLFLAAAAETLVVARGTLFDVSLGTDAVRVTLLSGAVDVRPKRDAASQAVLRLAPGQMLVVGRGRRAAPQPAAQPAPARADQWPSGMLSFDETPLETVIAEANRYGSVKLRLGDPSLGQLRVTGASRATDTAGLARLLAATLGLQVETAASGDLILQPAKP